MVESDLDSHEYALIVPVNRSEPIVTWRDNTPASSASSAFWQCNLGTGDNSIIPTTPMTVPDTVPDLTD